MKIVAVTACPTGVAHTYMAAEALKIAAQKKKIDIKVETRGAVGVRDKLTEDDIKEAYAVIIAADTHVSKKRFKGKVVVQSGTKEAIANSNSLIDKAAAECLEGSTMTKRKEDIKSPFRHFMYGISFIIPLLMTAGVLKAVYETFGVSYGSFNSVWKCIKMIESAAYYLVPSVLSSFISYSIADKPGFVPGIIGGIIGTYTGCGFLGGIVSGFISGYLIIFLKKSLKFLKKAEAVLSIMVLPVIASLISGMIMFYIPLSFLNKVIFNWLCSVKGPASVIIGGLGGILVAFDMGGPVNKFVYSLAIASLQGGNASSFMASIMAAGMTPPLGFALASAVFKKKFTEKEREEGKKAWILGLSFVTEGALYFKNRDSFKVILSAALGSMVSGMLSMFFGCRITVPHGGIFAVLIPNVVINLKLYIISILAGMLVTTFTVIILKKDLEN